MFPQIPTEKLTGEEKFKNSNGREFSVSDFWKYGFSNLNSNVLRGALAEFIVENSLKNVDDIDVRNPWGDFDVLAANGKKIEVKSSAYIQEWAQDKMSTIQWTGLKAKVLYWSDAVRKKDDGDKQYKADVYVFSLVKHQDQNSLDILDLDQWVFYVLSKDQVREVSNNGSSLSLVKLKKAGFESVGFEKLAEKIIST